MTYHTAERFTSGLQKNRTRPALRARHTALTATKNSNAATPAPMAVDAPIDAQLNVCCNYFLGREDARNLLHDVLVLLACKTIKELDVGGDKIARGM